MFEKDLRMDYLLDFYGEILPDRTREIMEQYYEDDLSLGEIADSFGITRQAIRHVIKKGEQTVLRMEEALGLAARFTALAEAVDTIRKDADELKGHKDPTVRKAAEAIVSQIEQIERQL